MTHESNRSAPRLQHTSSERFNNSNVSSDMAMENISSIKDKETFYDKCASVLRLCISDKADCTRYLIDTGADCSVYPYSPGIKPNIQSVTVPNLYAANGTLIITYGVIRKKVNLDLRRDLTWNFIIANYNSFTCLSADVKL